MDADRLIELLLGGAALHRDRDALDDLRGVGSDHVAAEHPVGRPVDDQLHHRALLAAGERVLHRPEARAIDVDRADLDARLGLGQADRRDRRLAEDGGRHVGRVELRRIVVEQRLGQGPRLGDRHRRQVQAVGDVADRVDRRDRGLGPFVDRDRAGFVRDDADVLEPDALGIGPAGRGIGMGIGLAAGRVEHLVDLDRIAALEPEREPARPLINAGDLRVIADLDAVPDQGLA